MTTIEKEYRAVYQRWASELRAAGIPTELYVGTGKVAKQFKYADRRRFSAVVVAGGNEIEAGEVSIKDLRLGEELSADVAGDRKAWLEELPGQVTVKESDLVAEVQQILARYQ